jgi:phage FluMu protein Com
MIKPLVVENYFIKIFQIDDSQNGRPNPMIIEKKAVKLIISDHHCLECDYIGGAPAEAGKVECPECKTINDIWMRGMRTPENHDSQTKANVREN